MKKLHIGFLIYPGLVQLDVMGVYQVLSFNPDSNIYFLWRDLSPVISNEGFMFTPTTTFHYCPPLDVICVPGGGMGQIEVMHDERTLDFLKCQGRNAKYVTSVCTGSLILAAAGLLQGYKSACHWAFRRQLALLGVDVLDERVVIDRNRITGAGVTSGIDFGLVLMSLLYGDSVAKSAQLMMEYMPEPPFNAGSPNAGGVDLTGQLLQLGKPMIEAFEVEVNATALRLGIGG